MLEILGILIGFTAVILLLSIVATALVQSLSMLFRVRRTAFEEGIATTRIPRTPQAVAALLETLPPAPPPPAAPGDASPGPAYAQRDPNTIAQLLDQPITLAQGDRLATWIDKSELTNSLAASRIDPVVIAAVEQRFEQMKRVMEDTFLVRTRLITIACAAAVVAVFPVSTPHLLERLLKDDEFRTRAEAMGTQLAQDPGEVYHGIVVDAGLEARAAFLAKHPDLRSDLGEVTIEARSVDDLLADVETALEGQDDQENLSAEYRELVEQALGDSDLANLRAGFKAGDGLSGLGIKPFAYCPADMKKNEKCVFDFGSLFGIFFTVVLLSLGAPFWYERLKELVGLKDALRKKEAKEQAKSEKTR